MARESVIWRDHRSPRGLAQASSVRAADVPRPKSRANRSFPPKRVTPLRGRWGAGISVVARVSKFFRVTEPERAVAMEEIVPRVREMVDLGGLVTKVRGSPNAPVAQLDRALVYGTKGRKFESSRARSRIE